MDAPMSDAPAVAPANNDPTPTSGPPTDSEPATVTAIPAPQSTSAAADPNKGPSRKKAKKSHTGDSTAKHVAPSS